MQQYSFCISKDVLGTEKNLLCRKGSYSWVDEPPGYAWLLSTRESFHVDFCLNTLARLNDIELKVDPPQRFVTAMQTVLSGSNAYPPPWQHVMPVDTHKGFVRDLIKQVVETLDNSSQEYYRTIWMPGNRVLRSLKRAKINPVRYAAAIESGEGNVPALKSFKPQMGGYAGIITYNRFGSRTGRITIDTGPSILTLKKEHRNIIESRYGSKGKIVIVDFANLEPRVLLYEAGKRCDDPDLYTVLNNELFHGDGDRKIVKAAVISELYGISRYTLQKNLEQPLEVIDEFTKRIRAHFETGKLLKRIKACFVKEGYILNRFGRRVKIDEPLNHILVNSYAQSTGVDIAMLGFEQIIERCEGRKITPICLLVDALILDVHEDEMGFLKLIKSVKVPGYVQSFYLSQEHLE